jgi:hypothetical protein
MSAHISDHGVGGSTTMVWRWGHRYLINLSAGSEYTPSQSHEVGF